MRTIELLAPAKNLECGIAAIDHGADAVYIGAERFGARVAAGNSVDDIRTLCTHAHQFGAKVYVTVNTIVYDDELKTVVPLCNELAEAGVDALLIQDMGVASLLREKGVSLTLHASTQTDNRSLEKVKWLREQGFRRVVLARELSVEEIRAIHEQVPDVELEVFVHGALCVSYSGACYASEYCFGRSANRGACAQFCRLKFDLVDANGQMVEQGRHLLSLKDMCQIDALEELLDAGACSLKIEGRLKDVCYVKNVVAAYSQRLNEIIDRQPGKYCRASEGRCTYTFTPNLKKTFNRGFTHYFLHGRQPDIASFDTPKALGEYVGKVKEIRGNSLNVAGTASFANGDGLCFLLPGEGLEGFRVNRVENNRLYPLKMPERLRPGMALYRNNDQEFERLLGRPSAERKIAVKMVLDVTDKGFCLTMTGNEGTTIASATVDFEHQQAQKPQRENIEKQLTKLGGTIYECRKVEVLGGADQCFIPSSVLAELRRSVTSQASPLHPSPSSVHLTPASPSVPPSTKEHREHPYLMNIANQQARAFYEQQGLEHIEPAFELRTTGRNAHHEAPLLMQCRHCLRYSLGYCTRRGGRKPQWREPLSLVLPDGKHFRLQFDCQQCQMNVYGE